MGKFIKSGFAFLCSGLVAAGVYWYFPKAIRDPVVEVGIPAPESAVADEVLSDSLTAAGMALTEKETPLAYTQAIHKHYLPALAKNPKNWRARALLASSYMRILEQIPRDEHTFRTISNLLEPAPPVSAIPMEYVAALAEYYRLLNRLQESAELLDSVMAKKQSAELFYQRALVSQGRGEKDQAIRFSSKANFFHGKASANPRYRLQVATLLPAPASLRALQELVADHPDFGPGLLALGKELQENGERVNAIAFYGRMLADLSSLDPVQREELYFRAAEAYFHLGQLKSALQMSEKFRSERFLELQFRIKAEMPETQLMYRQILAGWQKQKSKENYKAINSYVEALEKNRNDPTAFFLLGNLYESEGEITQAIDRYRKALAIPGGSPDSLHSLLQILVHRYEFAAAKELMAQAKATNVLEADKLAFNTGMMSRKSKQQEEAFETFRAALSAGTRYPELYRQMGEIASEHKEERLAEFYYSMALRYDPLNSKAALGLALARFHLDSPSLAVSFLKDKLNSQPNSAAIMTNLAILYLRSGDELSGKNYLQNAIRSDSHYSEAFRLLGDLTRDEGNRQSDYSAKRHSYRYALASYEMYSKLNPSDPDGYKATADLYFDIRDLGAAAKNYHKVLELTPNYPDVRLRLAQIARNGGDVNRAWELLDEEIKINTAPDYAWVEKANILMARKDFDQSAFCFTEAIRIAPRNSDALFGMGVVLHLKGSYHRALDFFRQVTKLNPLKADAHWQMGLIFQKQEDRKSALAAFTNYKGIVHEPSALAKADEKIRELGPGLVMDRAPSSIAKTEVVPAITLLNRVREANGKLTPSLWGVQFGSDITKAHPAIPAANKNGKRFANQFLEMQLPDGWDCCLDGTDWVCQNKDEQKKRDAVLVFSAQIRKPGRDELARYKAELEVPRSFHSLSGENILSEPKYLKEVSIAGHHWLEALHLSSEVPDFYTRYYATLEADLGIIVAFSVRKDKFEEYAPDLGVLASSLRTFRKPGPVSERIEVKQSPLRQILTAPAESFVLDPKPLPVGPYETVDLETTYQKIVAAYFKRDYAAMQAYSTPILAQVNDYKDTRAYRAMAEKGLEAIEEEKKRKALEERQAAIRREVAALEQQGLPLFERAMKDLKRRTELRAFVKEIYMKDPSNRLAAEWTERLKAQEVAEADAARTAWANKPREPIKRTPASRKAKKR